MNSSLKRILAAVYRPTLLILTGLCLLSPRSGLANNASPDPVQLAQPDGTPITLRIRGDAFFHWHEDLNGYTVVVTNNQYVYAKLGANNRLVPTPLVVGKDNPQAAGLPVRVLPSPSTIQAIKASFSPGVGTVTVPKPIAASGTVSNLVVLCKFSDHTFGVQTRVQSDYDTLMNKIGGDPTLAPTGSLRDYYNQASYGIVTIQSTVVAWVTLPHTEAYYANGQDGFGSYPQNGQGMVEDALKLVDALVDFGQFDHDNDGYIDAIDIIHSGYAAETGGGGGNWIWSHKWDLSALPGGQFTSSHKNSQGVNVKVFNYHTEAALWGTSGTAILRVGVIAHETGHFFGLPDLYDTTYAGEGIGSYCLMANSWGFDGTQYHPPIMSAWSKIQLGWVTPTVLNNPGTYTAPQAITTPTIYQITNGYPSGEYLLIENRQPSGFESDIPQGGLAIWHIDEAKPDNTDTGYPGQAGWPGNNHHYMVALLQADGKYDMEKGNNRGDSGDVYQASGVSLLSTNTVPNTAAYQNGNILNTSNTISSISVSSSSMTFVYGNGSAGVTPALSISGASALEGNSGTTPIVSTVSLSQPASTAVTVSWVTSNGTATAGVDYQAASNNLTFPIGTTSLTITNLIIGNTNLQANRTFYVNLTNATGATISVGKATMTIIDDDSALDLIVVQETNALNLASAILASGNSLQIKAATLRGNTQSGGTVSSSGLYSLNGAGPHTYGLTAGGVVLSTGNVMDYQSGANTSSSKTTAYGVAATTNEEILLDTVAGTTNYSHYDASQLNLYFDAPAGGSNQITFSVVFGSEEFPSLVNSTHKDVFGIFLNGVNIAYSSGLPLNAGHPDFSGVSGTELNGVLAPGGNPVMQFTAQVPAGSVSNKLTFILADTSDSSVDSTVYISSLQASVPVPPVYLTIQNTGVIEGNSGITNMVFPVNLSTAASQTISVQYATADGTATAGQDYYATNGTLTFAPGVTNLYITVPVIGDTLNEADESLYVVLLNPVNGILQNGTAVGVITNDDPVTALVSVDTPLPVLEGNSGTTNLQFRVRLSQPSGQMVQVSYATGGGTATPGLDYVPVSGQLFFSPGVQTQYVNVTVMGDTLYEDNETVILSLSAPVNALLNPSASSAMGIILDDDQPPSITVTGTKVLEGNSGTNNAYVTLTLSAPSALPIAVNYSTSDGISANPARAGVDYVPVATSWVVFDPGVTNLQVPVGIIGNQVIEPNKDFQVGFNSSLTMYGNPATVLILNDDGPLLKIAGAQMYEGNSGTNLMSFPVTLTQPTNVTVTVDYYTVDGTATVADNDYVSTNGTVIFAPNQTNATITVQVIGDTKAELNERFQVVLTNATVATIAVDTADGVILDDDTVADLQLTGTAPANGYVGMPVPLSLLITNKGTYGATNIVLTLTYSGATIQTASVSQGTVSNGTGTLTVQLGNLTNGATATANFGLLASQAGAISVQAVVLADQFDSVLANNTNSFSISTVVPVVNIVGVDRVLVSEAGGLNDGALQPGETVGISFVLTNSGTISTTNLQATLLPANGVTSPDPSQSYGAVSNGGPAVARTFTFTVSPSAGASITANLQLFDGTVDLGVVSFVLPVSGTTNFVSPGLIGTPDHGPATNAYPSIIHVAGVSGLITKVTATLSNVGHAYPADFDILLVSPAGDKVLIMSDAGGGISVTNITLTFDDAASSSLPQSGPLVSGVFKPTNYGDGDTFPNGPVAPFGTNMAAFNSHDPNGDWKLYVVDDGVGDVGAITGGWSLNIQTSQTINPNANLSLSVIPSLAQMRVGSNLVYTITVSNAGPATATSVRLTNVLGAGAMLVSSNISSGTLSVSGGTVIGDLGSLNINGVATVSLTVQPLLSGTLTNLAMVFAPQVDLQPQDNVSLLTTRVDRLDTLTVLPGGGFTNGMFSLTLDAAGGVTYVIQVSTNLVNWTSIYTNTTFTGTIQFSDPNASTNQVRFYRAIEQ